MIETTQNPDTEICSDVNVAEEDTSWSTEGQGLVATTEWDPFDDDDVSPEMMADSDDDFDYDDDDDDDYDDDLDDEYDDDDDLDDDID